MAVALGDPVGEVRLVDAKVQQTLVMSFEDCLTGGDPRVPDLDRKLLSSGY
jgi:hypothetical protein